MPLLYIFSALTVLAGVLLLLATSSAEDLCSSAIIWQYVKPTIGTTGAGYAGGQGSPAAQMPFGAMRIGPDTLNNTLDLAYRHCSGYNWVDANIRAFSHTRLVNAGVTDLGNFGVMPTNRRSLKDDLRVALNSNLWTSHYTKESEKAQPGLYSVYMDGIDVQADILVHDKFAGVHKYTWNPEHNPEKSSVPGLIFDVCHAADIHLENDGACLASSMTIEQDRRSFSAQVLFKGSLSGRGSSQGLDMYLYAALVSPDSTRPLELEEWLVCTGDKQCSVVLDKLRGKENEPATFSSTSGKLLSHVRFLKRDGEKSDSFQVELVVGLSFISAEQAKSNLLSSLPDKLKGLPKVGVSYYDSCKEISRNAWCSALSRVQLSDFETSSSSTSSVSHPSLPVIPFDKEEKDFLTIAYSALYRTLLSPTQYSEADGDYLGMDKQVHNSRSERAGKAMREVQGPSSFEYFSDLSLWDTFRTQHPWLLMTRPDVALGTLRSIGEMTLAANRFPKWVLASGESGCMIGIHGLAAVAEACQSGYSTEFDIKTIQRVAMQQSTNASFPSDRTDLERYLSEGFVSLEASDVAASLTLSYAFDDHSLGVISDFVGDKTNADASYKRAGNYKNIWSKRQQIMCPKLADGQLNCPIESTGPKSWSYYTEGDAEHWRWFVPHDLEGFVKLFPSLTQFEKTLEDFFQLSLPYHEKLGEAAPNPYYWAGNEVDLLTPFLFNYVNCTRTQYWTRSTLQMHFNSMPHGLPGNDDYGTMSANILFTSLGVYPLAGTTTFFVSSPRVERARVCVGESSLSENASTCSSVLEVITYGNSHENVFVEKLLVNGVEQKSPFMDRSLLAKGAKLEFFMTSVPKSGLCDAY